VSEVFGFNLDKLRLTLFCFESLGGECVFLWTEVCQGFFATCTYQIPSDTNVRKRARKTTNSTWFAKSHAYVVYIRFPFQFPRRDGAREASRFGGFDTLVKFITPVGARGY